MIVVAMMEISRLSLSVSLSDMVKGNNQIILMI